MKRIFYFLAVAVLAAACEKAPQENPLEKITDTVRGEYECRSIMLQGEPVDLDGDGKSSIDVLQEFETYSNAKIGIWELLVRPVAEYGVEEDISVCIPKQDIDYHKHTGRYDMNDSGNSMRLSFAYSVDPSGEISAGPRNEKNEKYDWESESWIDKIDYRDTYGVEMSFDGDGGLEVLVNSTYYDYGTNELLIIPTLLKYERISYSL